jgi:glycosyltransferase involved in cell wall biosynthesis
MDNNFERLASYMGAKTVKIYWGTGEYWTYENAAEQARSEMLMARRGIQLSPRQLKENRWVQLADAVIVIGNQVTLDTYPRHHSKFFAIENSVIRTISPPDLQQKNFDLARKNFLWMGSSGFLRRGLDLVLDSFVPLRDLNLWICGPLESESEQVFIRAYRRELFFAPNIHPLGWINIHSEAFRKITERCAFEIYASCTEAMAGSVLTCMGRGLIPLIGSHVGLDTDGFGVTFKQDNVEVIQQVVRDMTAMSPDVLHRMAQEAYRQACTRYSHESFARNIERILKIILEEA